VKAGGRAVVGNVEAPGGETAYSSLKNSLTSPRFCEAVPALGCRWGFGCATPRIGRSPRPTFRGLRDPRWHALKRLDQSAFAVQPRG
jgi:hypothetical protein